MRESHGRELERQLSGQEHTLILQRAPMWFSAPTLVLSASCNTISRGIQCPLLDSMAPALIHIHAYTHICICMSLNTKRLQLNLEKESTAES